MVHKKMNDIMALIHLLAILGLTKIIHIQWQKKTVWGYRGSLTMSKVLRIKRQSSLLEE